MSSRAPRRGCDPLTCWAHRAAGRGWRALAQWDEALTLRGRLVVGTFASVMVIAAIVVLPSAARTTTASVRLAATPAAPASDRAATDGADVAANAVPVVDSPYVRAARTCPGLDPGVLAAIHHIETRKGRDHRTSTAGAVGPMQFLPTTWAKYGTDGNGDGRADIRNLSDALVSAARLLCANGGSDPHRLPSAVWNYNHSSDYVSAVLRLARSGTAN